MKKNEMKKAILRARKAINRESKLERKSARREKEIRKLACYSQNAEFSYDWYNDEWETLMNEAEAVMIPPLIGNGFVDDKIALLKAVCGHQNIGIKEIRANYIAPEYETIMGNIRTNDNEKIQFGIGQNEFSGTDIYLDGSWNWVLPE